MRYILSLAFLLGSIQLSLCQVTNVEYFLNQDPGFGKATAVSVTAGAEISKDFVVPLTGLNGGFHTLFLRAKDAQGNWSLTGRHNFVIAPAKSTTVSAIEYFLDTDPGFGNGTSVPITPGAAIITDVVIPLTNTPAGYHVLHVRSKDDLGQWSLTTRYTFYAYATTGTSVTGAEYFIDTDPGIGSGTSLPFNSGANTTIAATIPLTDVSYGFHTLFIRTRDNEGRWSLTTHKVFYVDNDPSSATITGFEYYFTSGNTTSATYTYAAPQPAAAVDADFTANLSDLEANKEYTMYTRAVSSNGQKSQWYAKQVNVCSGDVAKANFDFIVNGSQASFIDSSKGNGKYYWDFGDGHTDSVSNPVHQYSSLGTFAVKQVRTNFCNTDTIVKLVSIKGINSVTPSRGGNSGLVTVLISGSGFDHNSKATINENGQSIAASSLVVVDNSTLQATFNLRDKTAGNYNVDVDFGNTNGTLSKSFNVVADAVGPKLSVDFVGRDAIRRGTGQEYELILNNTGLSDAQAVPVFLVIEGDRNLQFEIKAEWITPPFPGGVNPNDVPRIIRPDSLYGEPFNGIVVPLVVPRVNAESQIKLQCLLRTEEQQNLDARCWAGEPLIGPTRQSDVNACLENAIKSGLELSRLLLNNPYYTCGSSVAEGIYDTYKNFDDPQKSTTKKVGSLMWTMATTTASCVTIIFPAATLAKVAWDVVRIGADFQSKAEAPLSALAYCGKIFYNKYGQMVSRTIRNVASFDPNEKIGPINNSEKNHTRGEAPFNYTIYFENKNTATVPAQEVLIIDTLDKSKFDLSTLRIQSFGFGDSVWTTYPAVSDAQSMTVLLHRTGKPDLQVRINAKTDTAAGILTWQFLSIDPITRELINDPLDGFLPPNVQKGEGEGFIAYSIQPKTTLSHGTEIHNKASIYFDNNPPIVTNVFVNTIDLVAPVSKVTTLPAQTSDTTFIVKWSGIDDGGGIRGYDVYYAVNNGSFRNWLFNTTATSDSFTGKKDSIYKFYCVATDYAGNAEPGKTVAEASIQVAGMVTSVGDPQWDGFYFRQNYPNPAITDTWLEFSLPASQHVTIQIRDIQGKLIGTIANKLFAAGVHKLNYYVGNLAGGIYILELESKKYKKSIKLLKQ